MIFWLSKLSIGSRWRLNPQNKWNTNYLKQKSFHPAALRFLVNRVCQKPKAWLRTSIVFMLRAALPTSISTAASLNHFRSTYFLMPDQGYESFWIGWLNSKQICSSNDNHQHLQVYRRTSSRCRPLVGEYPCRLHSRKSSDDNSTPWYMEQKII